jgi:uncharacterized membrane protein YgaE (UPF0421/DUF939 family)
MIHLRRWIDKFPQLFKMRTDNFDAFLFSSKAAISAVVAVYCFGLFHLDGVVWAPISAVIVSQPKLHPSFQASLLRVAANLIGAFIGALLSTLLGHTILSLAIGVLVAGLVCHFARLDDALRPAYAAVVILTLSSETRTWFGSLDRVLAVTVGCVSALAVGFLFSQISWLFSPESNGREVPQDASD